MGTRPHLLQPQDWGASQKRLSCDLLILKSKHGQERSLAQEAMVQPKSFGSKVEIVQGSRNVDQEVALSFGFLMKQGHEVSGSVFTK